jgi:EVE domain
MTKHWIAVASANHVARGKAGGFMQVNHSKATPLKRLQAGDIIIYYSPMKELGGAEKLRAFTAFGTVKAGEPYQGDMGPEFKPFRKDVDWRSSQDAPIEPMLQELNFTRGKTNWGYQMCFGLFEITEGDTHLIAKAMKTAP